MVKGLGTVIYRVTDLGHAKAWYATAFGRTPYFDEPFYVGRKSAFQIAVTCRFALRSFRAEKIWPPVHRHVDSSLCRSTS